MSVTARFARPFFLTLGFLWVLLLANGIMSLGLGGGLPLLLSVGLNSALLALPFSVFAGAVLTPDPDPADGQIDRWPQEIVWLLLAVSVVWWVAWDFADPFLVHLADAPNRPEWFPMGPDYPWNRWAMADSISSLGPQEYTMDARQPWYLWPPTRLRFEALQGFGLALMTFVVGLVGLEVGTKAAPLRSQQGIRTRIGMWLLVYALMAAGSHIPFEITRKNFEAPWLFLVFVPVILQLLLLAALRLGWRSRDG